MTTPRYQFHELIATGGMGEVWRATDTALDRPVAIKLLKPEYAEDAVSRQRFDSEARHAAALHHPHIAAVYDVGEMPTASGLMRPYLVMELVDGRPLSELISARGALDPTSVRDLLGQAGDALSAAHRAGIVHRDIKPANLLVTADGQVKVTDFGIARAATTQPITTTGQVMGTPQYLSPEQARGEQATPASDVYGLGVVAFECLSGKRPFEKETPVATAIAHLYDPVPPLPASVPADLAAVVMKALSKSPADRYPDAAAFTAALRGTTPARTDTPAAGTPVVGPAAAAGVAGAGVAAAATADPEATQAMPPLVTTPSGTGSTGSTTVVPPRTTSPAAVAIEPEPTAPDTRPWWRRLGVLNWVLIILALMALIAVIAVLRTVTHGSASTAVDDTPTTSASPAAPTQTASASPAFDLPADCYAGQTVDETTAALKNLHLKPITQQVPEESGKAAQTVQYVTPCTQVHRGDTITVKFFPGPSETASPSAPASSATPSAPATSSAPTTTASPTSSPSADNPGTTADTTTPSTSSSPSAGRKDTTR